MTDQDYLALLDIPEALRLAEEQAALECYLAEHPEMQELSQKFERMIGLWSTETELPPSAELTLALNERLQTDRRSGAALGSKTPEEPGEQASSSAGVPRLRLLSPVTTGDDRVSSPSIPPHGEKGGRSVARIIPRPVRRLGPLAGLIAAGLLVWMVLPSEPQQRMRGTNPGGTLELSLEVLVEDASGGLAPLAESNPLSARDSLIFRFHVAGGQVLALFERSPEGVLRSLRTWKGLSPEQTGQTIRLSDEQGTELRYEVEGGPGQYTYLGLLTLDDKVLSDERLNALTKDCANQVSPCTVRGPEGILVGVQVYSEGIGGGPEIR